ncbi:O-antigen ligase family protein [Pseudonocardia acaciae]|uniref:O-antigen ligase family protein n=1 Tax=Pseudonocardia acaciae TaxID=551276 RepID=UPI00048F09FB|nr:O-antigen ligase family protein [Pseudonocardia acaciae]
MTAIAEVTAVRRDAGTPRRVPRLLVLALFVATLMGRFTLDRIGMPEFTDFDLRIVAIGGLLALVLMWRTLPVAHHYHNRWPPSMLLVLALICYLATTVFWAPAQARAAEAATDLGYLALLLVITVTISAPDPEHARRTMLVLLWIAGVTYAAHGLVIGQTDVQGRTTAFGGGPNVYVRVVVLGLIAAVALAVLHRRKLFLIPIPALVVAAILSGSRGGAVAAVGTALFVAILYRRRISRRAVAGASVIAVGVLLAGAAVLGSGAAGSPQQRFVVGLFQRGQFSDRPALLDQALSIAIRHPVFGGGLDSFFAEFGQSEDLSYPHNLVVDVAATGGLIGAALLVACAVAFVAEGRPWRGLPTDRVAFVAAALFIAIAAMFSGDLYDSRFLWVFAALATNRAAVWVGGGQNCCRPPSTYAHLNKLDDAANDFSQLPFVHVLTRRPRWHRNNN